MPLPNYGHGNKEKKTHQDLVFEMAPEIVSDEETDIVNGKRVKRKRGKVTTGKIGIDLERKLVINSDKDANIWKTNVDPKDIEDARKFSSPDRQVLKSDVRKALDSLISGSKAQSLRTTKRPSLSDPVPPSAEFNKNVRFSLPATNRQHEKNVLGVSIQPSGVYKFGSNSPPSRQSPVRTTSPPNIGQRVDPRYDNNPPPVRNSLTQAYHAKAEMKSPIGQRQAEITVSQMSSRSFSSSVHGIRGVN